MPYHGDYYSGFPAGDYYRGDPFFGKLLKGIGRAVGGAVKGVARIATRALPSVLRAVPGVGTALTVLDIGKRLAAGRRATRQLTLPQVSVERPDLRFAAPALGPGGIMAPGGGVIGAVTKRRVMNPANPRALRRALRRVGGFGKLARRAKRDVSRAASALGVQRRSPVKKRFGK